MTGKSQGRRPSPGRVVGPGGETRTVPEAVARFVWIAAGGRCTICNKYLLSEEWTGQDVPVGQLAHIVGWSSAKGSPRGYADLPAEERNVPANLMLLCYDQHHVIDNQALWQLYDAEALRKLKRAHESQIRQLTGLGQRNRTTVLRVVSTLHGQTVELSRQSVIQSLLVRERFPDWTLLNGADEFEVDLRRLPGEAESTEAFWISARGQLEHQLASLRTHVHREAIETVSIFALARIPILVLLGTMLDDTIKVDLYPKRRDHDEGWGWDDKAAPIEFGFEALQRGSSPSKVAVVFSVSGSVDARRLPPEIDHSYTVYELKPDVLPMVGVISSQERLDAFSDCWRRLLATIEASHPGAAAIPVFPAVPAAAAVAIGRHLMRAAHPPLRIYDRLRETDVYQYTTSTPSGAPTA